MHYLGEVVGCYTYPAAKPMEATAGHLPASRLRKLAGQPHPTLYYQPTRHTIHITSCLLPRRKRYKIHPPPESNRGPAVAQPGRAVGCSPRPERRGTQPTRRTDTDWSQVQILPAGYSHHPFFFFSSSAHWAGV